MRISLIKQCFAGFIFTIIITLLSADNSYSQDAVARTSEDTLSAGEVFNFTIKFRSQSAYDAVIYPDSSFFPDVLQWKGVQKFKVTDYSDSVSYQLQYFTDQDISLPPFPVFYIAEGDTSVIYTNQIDLYFKSVLPSEDAELKPIKPIFPFKGLPWAAILIIVSLILAAIFAYFTFRRKDEPEEIRKPVQTRSFKNPLTELQSTLTYLKEDYDLAESKNYKFFYSSLSDSIRQYYEDLYQIPALESTSRELLRMLDAFGVDHEMIKYTRQVLNKSDMVKFAKYTPTLDKAWECYQDAVDFTDRARLVDASRISRKRTEYESQFERPESETQEKDIEHGMG